MTLYNKQIVIAKLPDTVGTPMQGKLQEVFTAFCGEKEVYHNRFWESVQAGSQIDRMVELPLHRSVTAGMFAQFDGHIYSIEQAQFGNDANLLPITTLSLRQSEGQYDIAGP